MPGCCHLTRRDLLRWAALVATTPLVSVVEDPARAYGDSGGSTPNPFVPINLEASLATDRPLLFDLNQQQATQLESAYAASPGVFLHHSGHTHRNKRTLSPNAPGVVFQEVAAVKEYPGGFQLLRVFTGGYALNFYKFRGLLAQEWSERSRPEYGGLSPFYVFGNWADRNSVVEHDLSGSSRPDAEE